MTLKRETIKRGLRFGAVGGTVMCCFLGLNWLLAHWVSDTAAFLLAYPPAVGLHFLLNKFWTFGCERTDAVRQVTEYLVVVGVTFVIQYGAFHAAYAWWHWPHLVAAALANATQMLVGFSLMQTHVFAPRTATVSQK